MTDSANETLSVNGSRASRHVIGISEVAVSKGGNEILMTYALGSCIGVAVYDPVPKIGGLLHAMLPKSSADAERAKREPCMFVDSGMQHLFKACYAKGADKSRMVVYVAGGAKMNAAAEDRFAVGRRNATVARKLLWKNGVLVRAADVGGTVARTFGIRMDTGQAFLQIDGKTQFMEGGDLRWR
ncbi:MAG: chemotaxis protein CheD [Myxococcota bacterium]